MRKTLDQSAPIATARRWASYGRRRGRSWLRPGSNSQWEASVSRMPTVSILPQPEQRAARGAVQRAPRRQQREQRARGLDLREIASRFAKVTSNFIDDLGRATIRGPVSYGDDGTRADMGGADHETISGLARERVRLLAEVRIKYVDFRAQRPPAILHITSISPAQTIGAQSPYHAGLGDAVKCCVGRVDHS